MSINRLVYFLLFLQVITFIPMSSFATTAGPDNFPYYADDAAVTFSFEDISSSGTRVLNGTNDTAVSITIPFSFAFYEIEYEQLSISDNGLITFGGSNTQSTNINFTTTAPTGNFPSLAALWDDWHFIPDNDGLGCCTDADGVYYEIRGTTPERRLIIQWNKAYGVTSSPESVTFEIILYESTNLILMQYQDITSGDSRDNGGSATVGVRNASGHVGCSLLSCFSPQKCEEQVQWSLDSAIISNSTTILYTPSTHYENGTSFAANTMLSTENCVSSNDDDTGGAAFDPVLALNVLVDSSGLLGAFPPFSQDSEDCWPSNLVTFTVSGSSVTRNDLEDTIPVQPGFNYCYGWSIRSVAVDSQGRYYVGMTADGPLVVPAPDCASTRTDDERGIWILNSDYTVNTHFSTNEFTSASLGQQGPTGLTIDDTNGDIVACGPDVSSLETQVVVYAPDGTLKNQYHVSTTFPEMEFECGAIEYNPRHDSFFVESLAIIYEFDRSFTKILARYPMEDCFQAIADRFYGIGTDGDGTLYMTGRSIGSGAFRVVPFTISPAISDDWGWTHRP